MGSDPVVARDKTLGRVESGQTEDKRIAPRLSRDGLAQLKKQAKSLRFEVSLENHGGNIG
jgi:hypothetical protein